jgi:hypothetical protein
MEFRGLYIDYLTRWRSWLRQCATSRKVAGSIPDGIIGIFLWHYPSGRIMALRRLGLLQKWVPVIFVGKWRRPVRRADSLATFMCRLSWNLGASTSWNPKGLSRPVMGLLYLSFVYRLSGTWASVLFSCTSGTWKQLTNSSMWSALQPRFCTSWPSIPISVLVAMCKPDDQPEGALCLSCPLKVRTRTDLHSHSHSH